MKIAIFSDCYLDLTGGIVTVINAEKSELESRGHTVYVFSSSYPKSPTDLRRLAKNHIYPVPSCKVFGRGAAPIARRPCIIERSILREHPEIKDFDIYYIHYEAGCSIAGIRLGHKFHIPVVQVMHGREDMGVQNLIPFGLRTITATLLNTFHSWYLPHTVTVHRDHRLADTIAKAKMWTLMVNHANSADLVISPSQHFRSKLTSYGVTKPFISLPHGAASHLFNEPIPSIRSWTPTTPLEIIWHSRLTGEKRFLPFLAALPHLEIPYHLSVYGDGPDAARARHFTAKHHLNVTFHGVQKVPVIWRAMQHSHLDILSSYNYDNYSMTLVEAQVAGLPALIVDPDMREILPSGTFLLTPDPSPEAIAATINSLAANPNLIQKMSLRMLSARKEKNISLKIDALEQIFTALATGTAPADLAKMWKTQPKT